MFAATKVFAIPELLEQVLLDLDFRDLFTLQRTSTTFRDVIAGSKVLRRAMLLELPDTDSRLTKWDDEDDGLGSPDYDGCTLHPLLVYGQYFRTSKHIFDIVMDAWTRDGTPIVRSDVYHSRTCTGPTPGDPRKALDVHRTEHSWRKMKLAASREVRVSVSLDPGTTGPRQNMNIQLMMSGQSTAGELADVVAHYREVHGRGIRYVGGNRNEEFRGIDVKCCNWDYESVDGLSQ